MRDSVLPTEANRTEVLQQNLLRFVILNLFIVACAGLALRAVPVVGSFFFEYKNILHAHSHFAFGGWITPLLVWMILNSFSELKRKVKFIHWRNVVVILLVSAYGMLLTFPVHGYAPLSIIFSTLSLAGTFYLSFILLNALRAHNNASSLFLKGAAFFLVVSAVGPLSLGPIMSSGNSEGTLYYNAIYTYLHFQYNGWFLFAIFAILYKRLEEKRLNSNGSIVFTAMFTGCLLTLPLSFLWTNSTVIYNIIGGTGAVVQCAGVMIFLNSELRLKETNPFMKRVHVIVLSALVMKCVLQLLSAIPYFSSFVYSNRTLIIAYLHMVMLGFVSLFGLMNIYATHHHNGRFKIAIQGFLFSFFTTEIILAINASGVITGFYLPHANTVLFIFSIAFPVSTLYMQFALRIHPDMKRSKIFQPVDI